MKNLLLGLIGDNIARSQAPRLHRLAGRQCGVDVQYDRLIPKDLGQEFDAVFETCKSKAYRGINVTYPYKEHVTKHLHISDPLVRAMGAVNTVLFQDDAPHGFNTDYTGFMAAYRGVRQLEKPGVVCLIGTGGVGRAIAFALLALKATEIRLVDRDATKAAALARDLEQAGAGTVIRHSSDISDAAIGATGLVNCTPVGMVGYDGTPLPAELMAGADWVFDAVYTPVETQFLQDATQAGLVVISGYELFFFQGVHAWAHFAGLPLDEPALRASLLLPEDGQ